MKNHEVAISKHMAAGVLFNISHTTISDEMIVPFCISSPVVNIMTTSLKIPTTSKIMLLTRWGPS